MSTPNINDTFCLLSSFTFFTKIGPKFQTLIPNQESAYFDLINPEFDAEVAEKFLNRI